MVGDVLWVFRTPLSAVALVAVAAVAVGASGSVAQRLGWNRAGTTWAMMGAGFSLIPTLVTRVGYFDFRPSPAMLDTCRSGLQNAWLHPIELMNLVLLVPLAAGLMWASCDALLSLFLCLVWAAGVEALQAITGLGACEGEDALRYVLGAAAAVLVVGVMQGSGRQRAERSPGTS